MAPWKGLVMMLGLSLSAAMCRPPGETAEKEPGSGATAVELPGVDTSKMTDRERKQWSQLVGEMLAPCSDTPVTLAQCVKEKRACDACRPAVDLLAVLVKRGATRTQAEEAFRVRFASDHVTSIELADSPSKGPKDAAVTIVEWADFECPYCQMMSPVLDRLVRKYPGHVRIVFKEYPLPMHHHAEKAARAAVAAGKQGKFWEMHKLLFENGSKFTGDFTGFARQLKLDIPQFKKDLDSEVVADVISRDKKQGGKVGVDSTPTIFINGRRFTSAPFKPDEDLEPWIELEIKLRTGKDVKAVKLADEESPSPENSAAPAGSASAAPSAGAAPAAPPGVSAAPSASAAPR